MAAIDLVLVLSSVLLRTQIVEAVIPYVYIRADGSIDPSYAPIFSVDNVTYTFTNDLYIPVIVERDNIIIDGAGYTLSRNGTGRGIDLTSRHNVTIKNLQIKSFQSGIWLQSSNCRVIGNEISNNTYGVWVFGSNNTLYRNTIGNNSDTSIVVDLNSSNNTIYENSIMNSSRGVWLIAASDNKFIHNNFIDNTQHVHAPFSGYANLWDDGYPNGGNYWSDYADMDMHSGSYQNETGRDGIGDTANIIDANNTDHYPLMTTYSPIYQGDFVLTDNDVYVIAGRFDINGSIIVEENATLILKNAILNFTQTEELQYSITLRNPFSGNPRLFGYNSTITSDFRVNVRLKDNSTATIDNSTISWYIFAFDYSKLSVSNASYIDYLYGYDSSTIEVRNSTVDEWHNYNYGGGGVQIQVYGSEIGNIVIGPRSINATISRLEPGLISYWSFITNSSVNILSGGSTPNVTLISTNVIMWRFAFYGDSNVAILNSTIGEASAIGAFGGSSVINLKSTTCSYMYADSSSALLITDSFVSQLSSIGLSKSWLINSTYTSLDIQESAKVHVSWYLDVQVIDSIGQSVPSADVTASYPNATMAEFRQTDVNGWARLTLIEKMMNATGDYPIGDYSIQVVYEAHSNGTTVAMTGNTQITMVLKNLIVPEFPLLLILPLFMIATLLAVIVYKRKIH
jgi:parallel beta-helix repeat protein